MYEEYEVLRRNTLCLTVLRSWYVHSSLASFGRCICGCKFVREILLRDAWIAMRVSGLNVLSYACNKCVS